MHLDCSPQCRHFTPSTLIERRRQRIRAPVHPAGLRCLERPRRDRRLPDLRRRADPDPQAAPGGHQDPGLAQGDQDKKNLQQAQDAATEVSTEDDILRLCKC